MVFGRTFIRKPQCFFARHVLASSFDDRPERKENIRERARLVQSLFLHLTQPLEQMLRYVLHFTPPWSGEYACGAIMVLALDQHACV